jgi:endonuclease G
MKKLLIVFIAFASMISCTIIEDFGVGDQSSDGYSITKRTTSVQCSGTTKSGNRCKNKTLSSNGRCYLHGGN